MSHAGCGYENMTILFKAVTCNGGGIGVGYGGDLGKGGLRGVLYPPVIVIFRVRTITQISDDS